MYVLYKNKVVRAEFHQNPVRRKRKLRFHEVRAEHFAAYAEVEIVVAIVAGEQRNYAHGRIDAEQPLGNGVTEHQQLRLMRMAYGCKLSNPYIKKRNVRADGEEYLHNGAPAFAACILPSRFQIRLARERRA